MMLVIKMSDTEQQFNSRDPWAALPVWGLGFTTEEVAKFSVDVLANQATKGTLIHREPQGEIDPEEPWFIEAHWLIEKEKVTGLRFSVKCTQDEFATEKLVRWKLRGDNFEMVGDKAETVRRPVVLAPATADCTLPEPTFEGIKFVHAPSPVVEEGALQPIFGGDSLIEMRVSGGKPEAQHNNFAGKALNQFLTSADIAINNPSDTRICITEFWMDFQNTSGEWERCTSTKKNAGWGSWAQEQFEVDSHASAYVTAFQGQMEMKRPEELAHLPADMIGGNGRPYCMRVHHKFANPLRARLTLKDDAGKIKTMEFGYVNSPMDQIWDTFEGSRKENSDQDFYDDSVQADMFISVENPMDYTKSLVMITTKKKDPYAWVVRCCSGLRNVNGSYDSITPESLRKKAFEAALDAKKSNEPMPSEYVLYGTDDCRLVGLFHADTGKVYAVRGEITIKHEGTGTELCKATAHLLLDFGRVTDEPDD